MSAANGIKIRWARRLKEITISGRTALLCFTAIILFIAISQVA